MKIIEKTEEEKFLARLNVNDRNWMEYFLWYKKLAPQFNCQIPFSEMEKIEAIGEKYDIPKEIRKLIEASRIFNVVNVTK